MILFNLKKRLQKKKYVYYESFLNRYVMEFVQFKEVKLLDKKIKTAEFKTILAPCCHLLDSRDLTREAFITMKDFSSIRSNGRFISKGKYEKLREQDLNEMAYYWKYMYDYLHGKWSGKHFKVIEKSGETLDDLKLKLLCYEDDSVVEIRPTDHTDLINELEDCENTREWEDKFNKKKLLKDFKDGNISKGEFLAKMENEM